MEENISSQAFDYHKSDIELLKLTEQSDINNIKLHTFLDSIYTVNSKPTSPTINNNISASHSDTSSTLQFTAVSS